MINVRWQVTATVECDAPGCKARWEDDRWETLGLALEVARRQGWTLVGGLEYCPEHCHLVRPHFVVWDGEGGRKFLPISMKDIAQHDS